MNYSIEEHKHRFASWASSRGAGTSPLCRFKVSTGKLIIEEAGLKEIGKSISNLPTPDKFDSEHKVWRNKVINVAKKYDVTFTHGVASKLINLYLKSIFLCGNDIENPKIKAIHPPIDSLLLDELEIQNIGNQKAVWKMAKKAKWSKFTSDEYEQVIKAVQVSTSSDRGLWEIEQYWQGYQ